MSDAPRSSPPPPEPTAHRTGSFPAVAVEVARPETTADRALRIALQARSEIGHAPIPGKRDPGSGVWMAVEEVRSVVNELRTTMTEIRDRLDAQDAASATWGARLARIGWKAVETLIPIGIVALLAWLSGWHR